MAKLCSPLNLAVNNSLLLFRHPRRCLTERLCRGVGQPFAAARIFIPRPGGSIQRAVGWTKLMRKANYQPMLLAIRPRGKQSVRKAHDSLLSTKPACRILPKALFF